MVDQLKAVIFDVDGTLAETERDGHRIAFNLAFLEMGYDWVWDEELYGELLTVAGGRERIVHYLRTYNPDFPQTHPPALFSEQIYRVKTRHYMTLLSTRKISLRSGVKRLIAEIREADLRMAIATSSTTENVTMLITQTLGCDALDWFECIATGDLAMDKKPEPAIFHHCIDSLGLSADDCLVIEDSENGVKAAVAAGIPTIVTFNDYTEQDDFSGALAVFDQLGNPRQACQQHYGSPISNRYLKVEDLKTIHGQK